MKTSRLAVGALLLVLALGLLLAACGADEAATTTASSPDATTATSVAPASSETSAAPASSATTAAAATAPEETLKIGVVLQLTDWYSAVDAEEKTDIEYVAQLINDEGGIKAGGKTYKVELVEEDGKSNNDGNTSAATKLILDDKVKFVVGPAGPFNSATTPLFEQSKVLHVLSYNTLQPSEMGPDTPYAFLGMDLVAQQSISLKALLQLYPDVKTIAIATADEATVPYIVPAAKDLAARMGLTIAGDPVLFSNNLDDFNPIATKLNALEADAVWFILGTPPGYGSIIKGLRTLGNTAPIVFCAEAHTMLAIVGPEMATGLVVPGSFQYQATGNTPLIDKILGMGDTKRMWFGMAPNGLYMLKQAIEAADSVEPDKVKAAWEAMSTIPTLYGDAVPSGESLFGMKGHAWAYPWSVAHIMNGQIEYIGWVAPDPAP